MVTEARQQLVGAIASFLLDHDLDVSAANLLIAHSAFSGINPRLARQIATRSQTADGITQQWLDELAQQEPIQPDRAELDRLVTRLETNLDTFQTNTKAARNATSDYGVKLEKHVTDLQQVQVTGELVTHLADLAKAMLFRGLPPSEAAARLDEAREQLAGRRLINRKTDEPFGQITFSGGVADVFGYNNARDALKAADDALYRAKESGRNRIELAGI